MARSDDLARVAGDQVDFVAGLALDDVMQRRFRYHLLRLTVAGLSREDLDDLGELARLAFQDADVSGRADTVKDRPGVSPLAFAIADIVARAPRAVGPLGPKAALLGAVLGAYTALRDLDSVDEATAATLGAVGGAVALTATNLILPMLEQIPPAEYLRMDD